MTQIVLRDAFDSPFRVGVVDGEITAQSDQAPVELVFTPTSARITAERLLSAADEAETTLALNNRPVAMPGHDR